MNMRNEILEAISMCLYIETAMMAKKLFSRYELCKRLNDKDKHRVDANETMCHPKESLMSPMNNNWHH